MNRRRLVAAMAALAIAPRPGLAAAAKRVAILSIYGDETDKTFDPILAGLSQRGWRRGSNLEVSFHVVEGDPPESLDRHARAAVESRPDAIITISTRATSALLKHTRSIPIVTSVGDPVGSGYAQSIARPGHNVTGLSQGFEVGAAKGVESIRILVPRLRRLAVFHGHGQVSSHLAGQVGAAANALGIEPVLYRLDGDAEARKAFDSALGAGIGAGVWLGGTEAQFAVDEAIRRRLPLVSIGSNAPDSGMVASFWTRIPDYQDRLAAVAARVLGGESPATIPFELPREFEIALNLRTARAIGLAIAPELRVRATRIVE